METMERSTRRSVPATGTSTQTVTLSLDSSSSSSFSSSSNQQQQQPEETLVLKLKPKPKPKKKVTWTEDTVDNEFMNKKSSKKCCIFHKEKSFDEDASDDEGFDGSPNGDLDKKSHDHDCHHSHGHASDVAHS